MIHVWRLSEAGPDNLGLAFTKEGLALGGTLLIERRAGRYVVREPAEIERLLKRSYCRRHGPAAERMMSGLATVAAALNADDQCLARIAAVHIKIPDLTDVDERISLEVEDALIRSAEWNPDLHPRTGGPPNPGWFAPTAGPGEQPPSVRTALDDDPSTRSDASPGAGHDDRVTLPPGEYIDELHDFLEWLANAKPEDEAAIRAEIRRYYYDVGDTVGGDTLNRVLSDVLEAGDDKETRQQLLNSIEAYARADPAEVAQARNLAVGAILLLQGREPTAGIVDAPSEVWKLGWAARGDYFNEALGANLPRAFKVIDAFEDGAATSIKSIDLNAATYQDGVRLTSTLNRYINSLADYEGSELGAIKIRASDIASRNLSLAVPKTGMTAVQQGVIEAARNRAGELGIDLIVTEF